MYLIENKRDTTNPALWQMLGKDEGLSILISLNDLPPSMSFEDVYSHVSLFGTSLHTARG